MTTELEKQFFDTFGIEPEKIYLCPLCKSKLSGCTWVGDKQRFECVYSWGEHPYYMGKEVEEKAIIDYEYPQITDRHYLELIVLHNIYLETKLYSLDYKSLKEEILQDLIGEQQLREIKKDDVSDDLKHQVQAIFEGGNGF